MSSQLEVDKRLALTQTKEDIAALNNEIGQIEVVVRTTVIPFVTNEPCSFN